MRVLITNDYSLHEYHNPYASLVSFERDVTKEWLKEFEYHQLGATRTGGRMDELLEDVEKKGLVKSTIIRQGRLSDFTPDEYAFEYRLISGNY